MKNNAFRFVFYSLWILVLIPPILIGAVCLAPFFIFVNFLSIRYFGGGRALEFFMDYRNYIQLKHAIPDKYRWLIIIARINYVLAVLIAIPFILLIGILSIPFFIIRPFFFKEDVIKDAIVIENKS